MVENNKALAIIQQALPRLLVISRRLENAIKTRHDPSVAGVYGLEFVASPPRVRENKPGHILIETDNQPHVSP